MMKNVASKSNLALVWFDFKYFLIFNRDLSDVEKQNWFKMLPIKLVTKNWLISIGLLWMIKSMENPSLAVTLAMKSLVNSHGQMVLSPKLFWMAIGCWLKVSTVWEFQTFKSLLRIEKAASILKINDFLVFENKPNFCWFADFSLQDISKHSYLYF